MSRYMKDPNNSNKQIPAPLPENAFDRTTHPVANKATKTPNSVLISTTLSKEVGFFFGSSASFAALSTAMQVDSRSYTVLADVTTVGGTLLNIHPTAWSGSSADGASGGTTGKVKFIYNSGLSTGGR